MQLDGVGGATGDPTQAGPSRAAMLRERWFACSSVLGWPSPAEWPHPTVDRVCAAVCAGLAPDGSRRGGSGQRGKNGDGDDPQEGVRRALERWAGARAAAGVGLAETLSDLAALHTAVAGLAQQTEHRPEIVPVGAPPSAARGPDGARLLRTVALAWTDVACGELAETAAVDPLSGLASVQYLRTRLAEVYRAARARGRRGGDDHALVVVTMAVRGWTRVAALTAVGEAAGVVFDAGESLAVVGRGTVVVLAPREGLAVRAKVLRRLTGRRLTTKVGVEGTPTVRIVALPATHDGACALLERLRETDAGTARSPDPGA